MRRILFFLAEDEQCR